MANLLEAGKLKLDTSGSKWSVTIIEGDRQGSSAYYPKEVLEADVEKFAGNHRIYMNHPSDSEKYDRPERNAQDIIGYVSEAKYNGKDIVGNANIFSDWQGWVKERAEAGVIALSIRASGAVDESGTLSRFTKVHSVDLVTEAGAGGAFNEVLESARNKEESESPVELPKEFVEALDSLVESVKVLAEAETKRAAKEVEAEEAAAEAARVEAEEAAKAKAPSAAQIAEALVEAKLTKSAQARVLAAVEGGADLAESIKAEQDIAAEVLAEAKKEAPAAFGHVEDGGKPLDESDRKDAILKMAGLL